MSLVHLVRHGHVHNPDKILYGRLPEFRLSDAGEAMARAVAEYFVAQGSDVTR
ncbi:MAG: histidine phosphatase family protein, partial [Actinomycetota bacterium]